MEERGREEKETVKEGVDEWEEECGRVGISIEESIKREGKSTEEWKAEGRRGNGMMESRGWRKRGSVRGRGRGRGW